MRHRSRFRRIATWTGVAVCVVLVATLTASTYRAMYLFIDRVVVGVDAGYVVILQFRPDGSYTSALHTGPPRPGWSLGYLNNQSLLAATFPLWIPLVIASIPTAILFYRDRRRPGPGCCKACGYDLTGNVSGVCPECGTSR